MMFLFRSPGVQFALCSTTWPVIPNPFPVEIFNCFFGLMYLTSLPGAT
jgi:hypothetical protein